MPREIYPEVPGQFGEGTDYIPADPPVVGAVELVLDSAHVDDLMTVFPLFFVTAPLRQAIEGAQLTGCSFGDQVDATVSEDTLDEDSSGDLPTLYQVRFSRGDSADDFHVAEESWVAVSDRAWDVLSTFRLDRATIRQR